MVCKVFGIEKELYDSLIPKERSAYKLLLYLFLITVAISVVSGGYLVYMIVTSIYFAIFGALFFGFIIFSVLRFSLVSTERNMKNPAAKFRVFSTSFLFRLCILLFFGTFVGFPLASLFQRPFVSDEIEEQRLKIVEQYSTSLDASKVHTLDLFNSRVQKTQTKLVRVQAKVADQKEKLKVLEKGTAEYKENNYQKIIFENEQEILVSKLKIAQEELARQDSIYDVRVTKDLVSFLEIINTSELPLFQFKEISTRPAGIFIVCITALLFASLFLLILRLTYSSKFSYSSKAIQFYRNQTLIDYSNTDAQNKKLIFSKFGVDYDPDNKFLDPPFNTKPVKQYKRIVTGQTLEEYLKCLSNTRS